MRFIHIYKEINWVWICDGGGFVLSIMFYSFWYYDHNVIYTGFPTKCLASCSTLGFCLYLFGREYSEEAWSLVDACISDAVIKIAHALLGSSITLI